MATAATHLSDLEYAALYALGYRGSIQDMRNQWNASKGVQTSQDWLSTKGSTSGPPNERQDKYLTSKGYTGTTLDKHKQALAAGTYYV